MKVQRILDAAFFFVEINIFFGRLAGERIECCKNDIIDIIQLHGNEDEEYIKKLKEKTEKPVIKAVRIDENKEDYSSLFVDRA